MADDASAYSPYDPRMYILALDAAVGGCSASVLRGMEVLALRETEGATGHAALLPQMAEEVMGQVGHPALAVVAVTVGPGSFTGVRAALALAHGVALAEGCPVVGVSVPEVLAEGVGECGREVWVAIDSRRAQVFLARNGMVATCGLDDLPQPDGPVAVAGDAAAAVAAALEARGCDVKVSDRRVPRAADIAAVALRRLGGALPKLAAVPLYVDPPAARLPERR
jgi:tRNA threonylcarbamoyladenosine biosynthesis protein TsaB